MNYTQEQLISAARFSKEDIKQINQCRRPFNRLGFGYQLSFVSLANRFPSQYPLEVEDEILSYTSIQLGIPPENIEEYTQRRQTVDEHRERIRDYLGVFGPKPRNFPRPPLNSCYACICEPKLILELSPVQFVTF